MVFCVLKIDHNKSRSLQGRETKARVHTVNTWHTAERMFVNDGAFTGFQKRKKKKEVEQVKV